MKIALFIISIFLFSGSPISLFSQKTATWQGGAPGRPTDWNCAKNWKEGRVPDDFSNVIIPGVSTTTCASPVISGGKVEVNALFLTSSATLTIKTGGQLAVFDNVIGIEHGTLILKGKLIILNGKDETMTIGAETAFN